MSGAESRMRIFPTLPATYLQKVAVSNSTLSGFLPIEMSVRQKGRRPETADTGDPSMGKGNNSQKNDKKNLKPKQDKTKPATKK